MNKYFISMLFLLVGCSNPPYKGEDVAGADLFVIDSYKIQEGKRGILELQGKEVVPLKAEFFQEEVDAIEEGDLLTIALHHPTRHDLISKVDSLSDRSMFRVRDGSISIPEVGFVSISGLPLRDAIKKLESAYREEIRDVILHVSYKERPSKYVHIIGESNNKTIPVDGKMRLFDLLSRAGIGSSANLFQSYLIRHQKPIEVDMYRLVTAGDMSQNIFVRGGDKLYIAPASSSKVIVLGEVAKQGAIAISSSSVPLRDVLAEAGGLLPTGDRRYIQVARGSVLQPKIYTLRYEHVVRLPRESLLLIPGDIVLVAAKPLTEWNRVVSDLLPTLSAYDIVRQGTKLP